MSFTALISGYQPIGEHLHQQDISNTPDSYCTIYGYIENRKYTCVWNVISILFLGIPYLIFYWWPKYHVVKYKKTSLCDASIILVRENKMQYSIVRVITERVEIPALGGIDVKYFMYHSTKYVWIDQDQCFGLLDELFPKYTFSDILHHSTGLTEVEHRKLLKLFGLNTIEVKVKSYWKLFIQEVFHPYYIFQIFSIILWCVDNYVIYAGCIFVLTLLSAVTGVLETKKQSQLLHDLVESSAISSCQVLRKNIEWAQYNTINAKELVPGDLLIIPKTGCMMPCDAVLIQGTCIVNESMLTGESVPEMKTPPHESNEIFNSSIHKKHTLFCGTDIKQTRYYGDEDVIARVVKTGFDTAKGSLLKSIMYPSFVGLEFYKDSMKFVLLLFVIAATGMSYCLYLYIERQARVRDTIIRTLDIITIVVPPALPAAITVAIVYSQNRLKKMGIFCISPPRINVSGRINLACFDKTGTLTEDGFSLYSVVRVEGNVFSEEVFDPKTLDNKTRFVQAMATCHALTRINGEIIGDPLDLNMFHSIDWELEEPSSQESANYDVLLSVIVKPKSFQLPTNFAGGDSEMYQIGILRVFQFASELQCMSVICRELLVPNLVVYTKGAPEKIFKLCQPDSIPVDFTARLSYYTKSGKRVIAVAYKLLRKSMTWKDSQKITRDEVESQLLFLGLIVMENTLKVETIPVLSILRKANIRTLMITGDNIETAVSVARNCGMIRPYESIMLIELKRDAFSDQLRLACRNLEVDDSQLNINSNSHYQYVVNGNTWSELNTYHADLLPILLTRITVFARFQPNQKAQVVTQLQSLDYTVCMVGDGANDCGALKTAHVGISLSQTEASVAAPFTSTIENISCVIHLIFEGRCALVTSFGEIKYMAIYSMIQFFTILLLYKRFSILGDTQFLFIDLVITTTFALAIGRQGPSNELVSRRPLGSLMSLSNLIPLLMQMLLCALVQIMALYYLTIQPWFAPIQPKQEEVIKSWDNTVLFLVSCFQYIIVAILYSKGKPYRQSRLTNILLMLSAVILTFSVIYLCICPTKWMAEFFEILPMSNDRLENMFRYSLIIFPVVHFSCGVLLEWSMVDRKWLNNLIKFITCKKHPKSKYKRLLQEDNIHYLFRMED